MVPPFVRLFIVLQGLLLSSFNIFSQNNPQDDASATQEKYSLFASDEVLQLKISGNLNALFSDRGEINSWHQMTMNYSTANKVSTIRLRAKTRGNFRKLKENCKLPPVMLDFSRADSLDNPLFARQQKIKLVIPCQGDEFVVREYMVYKLYNLITPKSFKARLAQIEFEDVSGKRKTEKFFCFLIENENEMASRNNAFLISTKMQMEKISRIEFTRMAVFEYMIGNTDWSIPYLQNIKLISTDLKKDPVSVPYDFDHAGIVNAPYAGAAPELEISSTRQRIYRGYCNKNELDFTETFAFFNGLKSDIYKVYNDSPLLNTRYVKFVNKFLDDFYETINSDKKIDVEFNKPCRTNVRVELKGLQQ